MPMSSDPAAKKRSMANLKNAPAPPRGNRRALKSGAGAKQPVGDLRRAREDAREWLMELAPVRDRDGNLPAEYEPAIEVMALPLARLRHMAEYLETHPHAPGNFRLVREMRRTERHVWQMLESFGMTKRSNAALGLNVAATNALQRIEPVRTVERAREIARIMAHSGIGSPRTRGRRRCRSRGTRRRTTTSQETEVSNTGKRPAIPRRTLKITPSSFPGAKHALARLAGKPIRNQKRRSK